MKKIGFTTTVPLEIVLAAGHTAIDLNNIFVSDPDPASFIDTAHADGLPRNSCTWIKGLYTIGAKLKAVDEVIAVTNGDCSNTHALTELFESAGIPVHRFSYPNGESDPYNYLKSQMQRLASSLGTTLDEAIMYSKQTDPIRQKLRKIDSMTVSGHITGFENHFWQVSSSDFNSDKELFEKDLDMLIDTASAREPQKKTIRLGYIGVPPIAPAIYDFIEERDSKIVFNEVQRQFTIPSCDPDYVRRYLDYTYPYSVYDRINDIQVQISERKIDGIIHYVQSFCFRQIQDVLIRKNINIPILTIEGDAPKELDGRSKIRIESFIEMLHNRKNI